ncbi:MAG TPA: adenylate/guanylate cyclase domain-containing protein, partial [Burkholderiaceae bacterium]|nr:adenylate/guanylate cyclase domain-containing protein [Burkholderiaceae bacterium]
MNDSHSIETAIAALEAQRMSLGDAAVDAHIAVLRQKLNALPDAAHAGTQQLRQVCVLFMDIVGSTSLAQELDPEDMHAVLDGVLARATAIVERHGGKVLQYAGDGLLAAFGAELVAEDDAERAVRAGLALVDEGRRSALLVVQQFGRTGLDVRTGVHTGPVLLGGGVDKDSSIRGAAV